MNTVQLTEIKTYLCKKDKALVRLFDESHPNWGEIIKPPYTALIGAIIGQKIKYTKAKEIRGNLYKFLGTADFSIEQINAMNDNDLLSCGINPITIPIIRNVNTYIIDNKINMNASSDIRLLINVKGIGPWTIKTTLLTSFLDWSVFPYDDIFIRNNVKRLYGLAAKPTAKQMEPIAALWAPYQSLVCWYLWRWF